MSTIKRIVDTQSPKQPGTSEADGVAPLLARAARALLEGSKADAQTVLHPIAGETIAMRPRRRRSAAVVRPAP